MTAETPIRIGIDGRVLMHYEMRGFALQLGAVPRDQGGTALATAGAPAVKLMRGFSERNSNAGGHLGFTHNKRVIGFVW
jgi:hypothetical protein